MPPSPSLSARMMNVRYFTVTTIASAQKMSDSTPRTSVGLEVETPSKWMHSCSV